MHFNTDPLKQCTFLRGRRAKNTMRPPKWKGIIDFNRAMTKHLLSLVLWVTAHLIQEAFHKPASQLDTIITYFRVQVQVWIHNSTTSSLFYCLSLLFLQPTFRSGAFSTLFYSALTGYSHRNQTWCRLTGESPIILPTAHCLSIWHLFSGTLQLIICLVR